MAIDIRGTRNGYNTRCKWYKGEYVKNKKLIQNAVSEGVFYVKDFEPFREIEVQLDANILEKRFVGKIETWDSVGNLRKSDYVEYMGDLYLVDEHLADDANENTQYSSRPLTHHIITLRR